jgi:uncharacterized glyoxalase superfamily protein PhnB
MTFKSIAADLVVDDFDKALSFYRDVVGLQAGDVMEEDGKGAFVILKAGASELMLQARSLMDLDVPAASAKPTGFSGLLYFEVDDVEAMKQKLTGKADVVNDIRVQPYGMTEYIIKDPHGYILTFAQYTNGTSKS